VAFPKIGNVMKQCVYNIWPPSGLAKTHVRSERLGFQRTCCVIDNLLNGYSYRLVLLCHVVVSVRYELNKMQIYVDGIYIIPLGVVTCHTNYANNICDHSASYF